MCFHYLKRPLGASLLSLSYYETCNPEVLLLKLEHLLHADFFCLSHPALWFLSQHSYFLHCYLWQILPFPIPQGGKSLPCLPVWVMFKRIRSEFNMQKGVKLSVYSLHQSYVQGVPKRLISATLLLVSTRCCGGFFSYMPGTVAHR